MLLKNLRLYFCVQISQDLTICKTSITHGSAQGLPGTRDVVAIRQARKISLLFSVVDTACISYGNRSLLVGGWQASRSP